MLGNSTWVGDACYEVSCYSMEFAKFITISLGLANRERGMKWILINFHINIGNEPIQRLYD